MIQDQESLIATIYQRVLLGQENKSVVKTVLGFPNLQL